MGSSAKKKSEKKKDFKKPKLKVGKARPKPTNFTDTSFTSKSIVLTQQSISTSAPSPSAQFSHHLSLLSSRSSTQRRDSLAHLTTSIASRPVDASLPQPISIFLPKLCPLILDESNGVRAQLLRLLGAIAPSDVGPQINQLLLYIRAGLTHLAADIRSSSTDVLLWAVETCPNEVVACAGGWIKTLVCLLTVLHWYGSAALDNTKGANSWTSSRAPNLGNAGFEGKFAVKTLNTLAAFLRAGLIFVPECEQYEDSQGKWPFPLCHVGNHLISERSDPFAHMNLFGPSRNEDAEMYLERSERQKVFDKRFRTTINLGIETCKREGGELGRAAANIWKLLKEGMEGLDTEH